MRRYQRYKDSGVEWIGEIPEHWSASKVKWELVFHNNRRVPIEGEKRALMQGEYPYFGASGIVDYIDNYIFDGEYILVGEDGANILSRSTPLAFIASGKFWVNNHAHILSNKHGILKYFCQQLELNDFSTVASGSAQPKLTKEALAEVKIFVPTLSEQQEIVKYLDHHTSQIDLLISNSQKKIELLKEKRTALINHAVTKGLDPKSKMKDSGVEWIGEIPEHWDFTPIKRLLKNSVGAIKTGPFGSQLKSTDLIQNGIKVYNQRTVYDNDYRFGDSYISIEKYQELKDFTVMSGDLLITSRGTIGKCSIVPQEIDLGVLHPCLIRIQIDETNLNKLYLLWYLNQSSLFLESVRYESNATTIEVIYSDTIKQHFVPVPPLHEQQAIIEFLDNQTLAIDKDISLEQKRIELLKEYRQSLISEVVTGKIDVRNWKA